MKQFKNRKIIFDNLNNYNQYISIVFQCLIVKGIHKRVIINTYENKCKAVISNNMNDKINVE